VRNDRARHALRLLQPRQVRRAVYLAQRCVGDRGRQSPRVRRWQSLVLRRRNDQRGLRKPTQRIAQVDRRQHLAVAGVQRRVAGRQERGQSVLQRRSAREPGGRDPRPDAFGDPLKPLVADQARSSEIGVGVAGRGGRARNDQAVNAGAVVQRDAQRHDASEAEPAEVESPDVHRIEPVDHPLRHLLQGRRF
jgi:hypothetical protein